MQFLRTNVASVIILATKNNIATPYLYWCRRYIYPIVHPYTTPHVLTRHVYVNTHPVDSQYVPSSQSSVLVHCCAVVSRYIHFAGQQRSTAAARDDDDDDDACLDSHHKLLPAYCYH